MMSWLRAIGLLLLVLSCAAGGVLAGLSLRRRTADLETARALLGGLSRRLGYTLAPPAALVAELAGQPELERCDLLPLTLKRLDGGQPFSTAWRGALAQSRTALDTGDRALLAEAGGILGAFDLETQQSQLALLTERLECRLETARGRCEQSARLASTLGLLLGLGLAVLII